MTLSPVSGLSKTNTASISDGSGLSLAGGSAPVSPPVNTVAPVISGPFFVGQTLTTTDGTWTGSGISYTYQWRNAGVDIGGATNSTYVVQAGDDGDVLDCVVTATNGGGAVSEASSNSFIGIQLGFWVDGRVGVTHVANAVSAWGDQSGNARNVANTGFTAPTYNGTDGIGFNGSNQVLWNSSPFAYDAGACSIFMIGTFPTQSGGRYFLSETNSANGAAQNQYKLFRQGTGGGDATFNQAELWNSASSLRFSTKFGDQVCWSNSLGPSQYTLIDTGTNISQRVNSVAGGASATYTRSGSLTLDRFTIGVNIIGGTDEHYGTITELNAIQIVPRAVTTTERDQIEAYNDADWGL